MAWTFALLLPPPRFTTGSSTGCSGSNCIRMSFATMRTSGRTRLTSLRSATPSSRPSGWLATITTRPSAGMRSISRPTTL